MAGANGSRSLSEPRRRALYARSRMVAGLADLQNWSASREASTSCSASASVPWGWPSCGSRATSRTDRSVVREVGRTAAGDLIEGRRSSRARTGDRFAPREIKARVAANRELPPANVKTRVGADLAGLRDAYLQYRAGADEPLKPSKRNPREMAGLGRHNPSHRLGRTADMGAADGDDRSCWGLDGQARDPDSSRKIRAPDADDRKRIHDSGARGQWRHRDRLIGDAREAICRADAQPHHVGAWRGKADRTDRTAPFESSKRSIVREVPSVTRDRAPSPARRGCHDHVVAYFRRLRRPDERRERNRMQVVKGRGSATRRGQDSERASQDNYQTSHDRLDGGAFPQHACTLFPQSQPITLAY